MNETHQPLSAAGSSTPVRAYRVTPCKAQNSIPLQTRTEHEIICITQGKLTLRVNDITYEASTGDMFFIQSGALLSLLEYSPDCVYEDIIFDLRAIVGNDDACLTCCEHLYDNTWQMDTHLGRNPLGLRETFDKIIRCAGKVSRIGYELEIHGMVLQFIGQMLQDGRWQTCKQLRDRDARAQKAVRCVLSLIEENYARDLTLTEMAAAADLSPNYFCRYFKKIAGCSPVEYLIDYRINMAAYMLISTEDSIADIALACGFNDASHFIKFFRRKRGITPRRYRQLHAEQNAN